MKQEAHVKVHQIKTNMMLSFSIFHVCPLTEQALQANAIVCRACLPVQVGCIEAITT